METKLFQFLQDKKNEEWSQLLTLAAIHHLADAVLLATRKLIESKMTLRSRIVSLHGDGKSSGKLHMVSASQFRNITSVSTALTRTFSRFGIISPQRSVYPRKKLSKSKSRVTLGFHCYQTM
jgi:hypothetical protein